MIYLERTVTINKGSASIDEPVILYKGDKNVEIQFQIKNNPYKSKTSTVVTYGQLIIDRANADSIFSSISRLSSNKVLFVITGDMIDDLNECGNFDFQIRLFNEDQSSRATLAPIKEGIIIKEPICEGDSVDSGSTDESEATEGEALDIFNEEGNYNKTIWESGDLITTQNLNKVEGAIDYLVDESKTHADINHTHEEYITEDKLNEALKDVDVDLSGYATKDEIPTNVSELNNDAGYLTEHQSLEDYVTKEYVDATIADIAIPTIPTDVSAFNNDARYVNEDRLESYATKSYVDSIANDVKYAIGAILENISTTIIAYKTDVRGLLPEMSLDRLGEERFTDYVVNEINNGDGTYTVAINTFSDALPAKMSFSGNSNVLTIDKLNTTNIEDMTSMFQDCTSLTSINGIADWDTSKLRYTENMFRNCTSLKSLDLSNWDVQKLYVVTYMFGNCASLETIDLSNWDLSKCSFRPYGGYSALFTDCNSLHTVKLDNCNNFTIDKIMGQLPTGTIEGVTRKIYCKQANAEGLTPPTGWVFEFAESFYIEYTVTNSNNSLNTVGLPYLYSSQGEISQQYDNIEITLLDGSTTTDTTTVCSNIGKVKIWYPMSTAGISFYTENNYPYPTPFVKTVDYIKTDMFTNMKRMFNYCDSLTSIPELDTSKVTNMKGMFSACGQLKSIPELDTSNVTNMEGMFSGCSQLTSIPELDTSKVTNMKGMFSACGQLKSIPELDTSNVTNMEGMFQACSSLTSVPNFDTSNVTNMYLMFNSCGGLKTLDLSGWDTSNVLNMANMFNYCSQLTSLNLSSWDTSNVTNMSGMLQGCNALNMITCNVAATIDKIAEILPTRTEAAPGTITTDCAIADITAASTLASKYWDISTEQEI